MTRILIVSNDLNYTKKIQKMIGNNFTDVILDHLFVLRMASIRLASDKRYDILILDTSIDNDLIEIRDFIKRIRDAASYVGHIIGVYSLRVDYGLLVDIHILNVIRKVEIDRRPALFKDLIKSLLK